MRDIVPKTNGNRSVEPKKIGQYINQFDVPDDACAMKRTYDMDQESVSSQDSGTSSNMSGKSDVPTYRSYQKYLDGYNTLKFKPVKPGKLVETFQEDPEPTIKPHAAHTANNHDVGTHKAEIMIQVCNTNEYPYQPREVELFDKQTKHDVNVGNVDVPTMVLEVAAPPPPPLPPAMPHVLPSKINSQVMSDLLIGHNTRLVNNPNVRRVVQPAHDLKTCLLDELKAKHPPKEYQCRDQIQHKEVRRTSVPINTFTQPRNHEFQHNLRNQQQQNFNLNQLNKTQVLPQSTRPPLPGKPGGVPTNASNLYSPQPQNHNKFNSLPRRYSEHNKINIQTMLSNPEAQTVTRVPSTRPDAPVDRDDPSVKKLVYATLRNYVGAYNNRANLLAAQHDGHVVQDKGVTEQIKSISASINVSHLNGRVNPKETE